LHVRCTSIACLYAMGVPVHRIVILGGGTGGTLTANRLRKIYHPDE
jgi:spermidine synthase